MTPTPNPFAVWSAKPCKQNVIRSPTDIIALWATDWDIYLHDQEFPATSNSVSYLPDQGHLFTVSGYGQSVIMVLRSEV